MYNILKDMYQEVFSVKIYIVSQLCKIAIGTKYDPCKENMHKAGEQKNNAHTPVS